MINRFAFISSIVLLGLLVLAIAYVVWGLPAQAPGIELTDVTIEEKDNGETLFTDKTKNNKEDQAIAPEQESLPNIDSAKRSIEDTDKQLYTLLLGRHTRMQLAQSQQQALRGKDIETEIIQLEDDQQQSWWWLVSSEYSLQQAKREAYRLKMYHDLNTQIKKKPPPPPPPP